MVNSSVTCILKIKWGIFPSTFLQPVNGSKNSILNRVMKFNLFMCFFFFFVFETPLNDFPFYSPILLTLWFRYLQTRIKESRMYLSSQLFFKTPNKTLKFQEKYILQRSTDLNSKNISFGVYHRATPRSHWTKQTVKKLNLWGRKTAVDKSAWVKAWKYKLFFYFLVFHE